MMNRLFSFVLAAALALGACRFAPPADPVLREHIDGVILPALREGHHVGIVVGVIRDGRSEIHGYGSVSRFAPRPPDGRTLFEIGSITKTFTAALLADMADRGEVALDQPVQELLPGFKIPRRNGRQITLAHLATHTSGLPRLPHDFGLSLDDPFNPYVHYGLDQLQTSLSGQSLRRDPGDRHLYSNLGAGLLGQALAHRAGIPYGKLLRERVLLPLGLEDTAINLTADQQSRLAPGHAAGNPVPNWDLGSLVGAGALRSNVDDMIAYLRANMEGRTPMLETGHAPRISKGHLEIGLAWHRSPLKSTPAKMTWHNGGTGGYRSFLGFIKEPSIGVVVLANSAESVDEIGIDLLDLLAHLASSTLSDPAR